MIAITYHGNRYWSIYYHQRVYNVSDLLTAATVLGVVHQPKAFRVLAKIFNNSTECTTLLKHPAVRR